MKIFIRKALFKDAQTLIKIYNDAFYTDYVKYGVCPAYGRSIKQMKKSIQQFPKYIAYDDSVPVGVVSAAEKNDGVYYIGCLCVIPDYQGKGIGSALVDFIKNQYTDWQKLELITPIDNEKNVRFYTQKCGFTIQNEEKDKSVKVYRFSMQRNN